MQVIIIDKIEFTFNKKPILKHKIFNYYVCIEGNNIIIPQDLDKKTNLSKKICTTFNLKSLSNIDCGKLDDIKHTKITVGVL
jgi:hypothetical protein